MEHYITRSPVLFMIFKRPDLTSRVFEQIRKVRPARLYIAADGPRPGQEGEQELCMETRRITEQIDWDCELKTLFREKNLGCRMAISSALDWFFGQEEEGIILEDDCLPNQSFFRFCDAMLEKYRNDNRIRHISGCNLQHGKKWGTASYYFSNLTHAWGWASWRRVWNDYDRDLSLYDSKEVKEQLAKIFTEPMVIDSWHRIFDETKAGKINTWDYQLTFINFFHHSLSIIPNINMISNIGFGANSTHTSEEDSVYANIPQEELGEITHPLYFLPEKDADFATLNYDFRIDVTKAAIEAARIAQYKRDRRLKNRIKKLFKK
jgi:hypothetical protein